MKKMAFYKIICTSVASLSLVIPAFGQDSMQSSTLSTTPSTMQAPAQCQSITEQQVADLFTQWNATLKTNDPQAVANLYADKAVLLPTVSDIRTGRDQIKSYFEMFLPQKPQAVINSRNIFIDCNWAVDTGIYTFTLSVNGQPQQVVARYTYVYEYENGKWLIINHHSSLVPKE